MAGVFDGELDEGSGERLKLLAIVNGGLEGWHLLWGNALAEIGPFVPDLVLVVWAGGTARGVGAKLGLEAAEFHRF